MVGTKAKMRMIFFSYKKCKTQRQSRCTMHIISIVCLNFFEMFFLIVVLKMESLDILHLFWFYSLWFFLIHAHFVNISVEMFLIVSNCFHFFLSRIVCFFSVSGAFHFRWWIFLFSISIYESSLSERKLWFVWNLIAVIDYCTVCLLNAMRDNLEISTLFSKLFAFVCGQCTIPLKLSSYFMSI